MAVPNLGERAWLILAQHGVQRQQLHIVALAWLNLHTLAASGVDLYFERAAIIDPLAGGIAAAQSGAL